MGQIVSHHMTSPRPTATDASSITAPKGFQYGLLGLPLAFVALPVYVHLPNFYAQSFGVSLGILGAILLLTRCFDGLIDPWLGRQMDRVYESSSRRVLWVASALAALLALGFAALFLPPDWGGHPNGQLAWLVGALLLSHLAYSGLGILHQAWAARQGGGEVAQSRWVTWREGLGLLGVLMASTLPTFIGWLNTTILLIALLLGGLWAWSFRLRTHQGRDATANTTAQKRNDSSTTRSPLRFPNFRRLLLLFLLNGFASAIPATLVLFFVQDGLQASKQWEAIYLGVYFAAGALSLPLWLRLIARVGLAKTWRIGMLIAVAAFVGVLTLGPGDLSAFFVICLASGLALGADLAVPGALLNRLIDECGERQKSDAAFVGWWNLVTKMNLALAAGLSLPLLGWLGYTPGQQDPDALWALQLAYGAVPCTLKLLAAFALSRWLIKPIKEGEIA